MSKEVPKRIWLSPTKAREATVWEEFKADTDIEYVPATELQRVREDTWKKAIRIISSVEESQPDHNTWRTDSLAALEAAADKETNGKAEE